MKYSLRGVVTNRDRARDSVVLAGEAGAVKGAEMSVCPGLVETIGLKPDWRLDVPVTHDSETVPGPDQH